MMICRGVKSINSKTRASQARIGRDIFRRRVQTVRHRTLRGLRPKSAEDVIGPAAEEQIEGFALSRDDGLSRSLVVTRRRPSAVGTVAVFVRSTGSLDHAVQRDVLDDLDLSHGLCFARDRARLRSAVAAFSSAFQVTKRHRS